MANWNTPAGTIGNYTQGQSLTFTLSASPTLGGTIRYVLANGTTLPSGLTLNTTTGVISGTPDYVSVNTINYFSVNAIETSGGIQYSNIRAFSINITTLVWNTASGSIGVFAENSSINYQFTATKSQSSNTVQYTLLNGTLPIGTVTPVTLNSTGLLTGIPNSEIQSSTYNFSVRAIEYNGLNQVGFKDRTFSITVDISTPIPEFTTPSGSLFSADDSTWQSFQLQYIDQDPNSPISIQVVLGSLPPGLEINSTGLIRGYPDIPPSASVTYEFTLEISSINGRSTNNYNITINNQGSTGREPVILNTQPLTFVISNDDPYKSYYLTSDSLGNYPEDTEFIFKIIGYNFDGQETDLTYVFNSPTIGGLTFNAQTGWISGLFPTIGDNVVTYNFTVFVEKTSDPTLFSDTLFLSMTVIGNSVTEITWTSSGDLGTINNGAISDISVDAIGGTGLDINYRIVGSQIQSNLKTLSYSGIEFSSFGDQGAFVTGTDDGETWTNQTPINSDISLFYFTSSVYNGSGSTTVVVGYNQIGTAIIGQVTDSTYGYTPSAVTTANPLRKIIYVGFYSLYIAVGDNGTITTTNSPDNWSNIQTTPTFSNLNGVCYSNETFGLRYVAVGDNGTILTSNNAITWTSRTSGTTLSLRSVIFDDDKFIIVGDLGLILTSINGIVWTVPQVFGNNYNFKSLVTGGTLLDDNIRTVAVGDDGVIIESFDHGVSWFQVTNVISTSNITDIIYDNNTNSFYMVGDVGTILVYNNDPLTAFYNNLSSPTLDSFPPDLILLSSGDISGRLAFESTDSVQDQDVTRTYSFTIQAFYPAFPQINSIKTFTLTTLQKFYLPYDTVYIKALPSIDDRSKLNYLLVNDQIIPPEYIYRADDSYFGKSTSVIYDHIYGVPSIARDDFFTDYVDAVQINHYWRNITLGEIKVAVARDSVNNIIYEVVYSAIQDNLVNAAGQSISKEIVWPRTIDLHLNNWVDSLTNIYTSYTYDNSSPIVKNYISSLNSTTLILDSITDIEVGMVMTAPVNFTVTNDVNDAPPIVVSIDTQTSSIVVNVAQTLTTNQQVLFNNPLVTSLTPGTAQTLYPNSLSNMRQQIYDSLGQINDQSLLPTWMVSQQLDGSIPGFTPAWVICYTKVGFGEIIKNNIETLWPYKLNEIDFQLDRFEVDRSKTYNYDGVNINGQPIWDTLPSAQPNVTNNDADSYIYFPRKTILPNQTQ
jgi:photosystem II stability/assembly factor-like uncharacterized protein